ncbi:uncharacterized protein LOC119358146 [Triticum dicoccoides]|uniref:uncharacterized protein LOC119358146 n=1 Tax=Triticum dicoccoides TaxID=85692 RepID=UPI00188E55E3|nr:uncharacterized protein LOC119358146 [Triticum dicoccoides]
MEFKHLCLVRFKEGVVVDDIIEELTKLAGELDTVKFFGWGKDVLNQEVLTHGFTHVFSMSFASAEDLVACMGHEKHSAFACHAGHTDNSEAVFGSSSSSSRRPLEVQNSNGDVQLQRVAHHDHGSRYPLCELVFTFQKSMLFPRANVHPQGLNSVVPKKPHG